MAHRNTKAEGWFNRQTDLTKDVLFQKVSRFKLNLEFERDRFVRKLEVPSLWSNSNQIFFENSLENFWG